jgi:undecaprenyl-diphosphatase
LPRSRLSLAQAAALGLLHGPAELLPISSSGHTTLVPWLLGWDYERLDGEMRKAFEVALHAGTAAALLTQPGLLAEGRWQMALIGLSSLPPTIAGYELEGAIERHLGGVATIAGGLIAGGVAMAVADRAPQRRAQAEVTVADALWLGIAQAAALVPGVSRSGATLAAARMRRFGRADAHRLSRRAGLPVIAGATALKGLRMSRRGLPRELRGPFVVGAAAAFTSARGCARLTTLPHRERSLLPYAAYRVGLGSLVLARLASSRCTTMRA